MCLSGCLIPHREPIDCMIFRWFCNKIVSFEGIGNIGHVGCTHLRHSILAFRAQPTWTNTHHFAIALSSVTCLRSSAFPHCKVRLSESTTKHSMQPRFGFAIRCWNSRRNPIRGCKPSSRRELRAMNPGWYRAVRFPPFAITASSSKSMA